MELRVQNRERELASEKRAGAWLHRRRVEQQYRFLRRNPRVFAFFSAVFVLGLPLIWLQPEWTRGFWLGALTATTVWLLVLVTWQMSGVSHFHQGELAEQWTVQELRPLTKRSDWRLINHVLFRPWDIDHILLGPAGVIVIETKGGNSDWNQRRHEPRLREAVRQAANNAADTRRFLRPNVGAAPVLPVVALWPASESFATRTIDGVPVLAGHRLSDWLSSLPSDRLDPEGAAAAWSRIEKHLEKRDAADLEREGRPPRTVNQLVLDLVQYPVGVWLGIGALAVLFRLFDPLLDYVVALVAAAVTALGARRLPALRHLLMGAFAGQVGLIIGIAVAIGIDRLF